jgi:hypothetical protein
MNSSQPTRTVPGQHPHLRAINGCGGPKRLVQQIGVTYERRFRCR